jgi:hypothetical protein
MTKLFTLLSRISSTVVLMSLFLPFMVVKCANQEMATATGIQLMTGDVKMKDPTKQFNPENPFNNLTSQATTDEISKDVSKNVKQKQNSEYSYLMIGIAILGILGLILSFLKMPFRKYILMGIGLIGIVLLTILAQTIDDNSSKSMLADNPLASAYQATISLQIGFYVCIIGFFMVFIEPIIVLFKEEQYE